MFDSPLEGLSAGRRGIVQDVRHGFLRGRAPVRLLHKVRESTGWPVHFVYILILPYAPSRWDIQLRRFGTHNR